VDIPTFADSERLGFNLRDFIAQYKLGDGAGVGGGAHMFRQVWNPFVSNVYENVLSKLLHRLFVQQFTQQSLETAEPKYGLPRKVDVYEEVKKAKRYL
jgi:large subunit ribosomal protein L35